MVFVQEIAADDWRRLRDLRLSSLRENPEAFGGNLEDEKIFDEILWRAKFEKLTYLIASVEGVDAAIMSIENLDGDFGATCWVGGCWVNPAFRGLGLVRSLFAYLDERALERDWNVQGLGVWTDNAGAIGAYQAIGFSRAGEDIESTRIPGKSYVRMIRKS